MSLELRGDVAGGPEVRVHPGWLVLVWCVVFAGCVESKTPGRPAREHFLDVLALELQKPPAEQDREHVVRLIEALRSDGEPPLPVGPYVAELEFSFDTRPRDRNDDGIFDLIDVTVWPKDGSGDTVKAIGTMRFVLRRKPPLELFGGEVLQTWFFGPQSVNDAWQGAWVFNGHHFELPLDERAREAGGTVVLDARYFDTQGREVGVDLDKRKHLKLRGP